jgi:hypothetical protein
VPPESLFTDELLRQLMAVGQVDVLVGIPTYNNAASVGQVVKAVHVGFARYFPRERTLLMSSDGGSTDGTLDVVQSATPDDAEALTTLHNLRTMHRVGAPYHGQPGMARALRTIFAAADLLQARAVAVLDPEVTSVTPEWIERLLRPVLQESFDFMTPVYPRHRHDGLLVTQLVRPLLRATYGHRIREPVGIELGCSGRFANHCLGSDAWENESVRVGIDLWVVGAALAGGFRPGQAVLGPRILAPRTARPALPELFQQIVGSLFASLEMHQFYWLEQSGSQDAPVNGELPDPPADPPAVDPRQMAESFRFGLRDLGSILEDILSPQTLDGLQDAASGNALPRVADDLWAATVYEFCAAYHDGVMHRQHLIQGLVPLYLGRAASFTVETGTEPWGAVDTMERRFEVLGLEFERSRPTLTKRWTSKAGGER